MSAETQESLPALLMLGRRSAGCATASDFLKLSSLCRNGEHASTSLRILLPNESSLPEEVIWSKTVCVCLVHGQPRPFAFALRQKPWSVERNWAYPRSFMHRHGCSLQMCTVSSNTGSKIHCRNTDLTLTCADSPSLEQPSSGEHRPLGERERERRSHFGSRLDGPSLSELVSLQLPAWATAASA